MGDDPESLLSSTVPSDRTCFRLNLDGNRFRPKMEDSVHATRPEYGTHRTVAGPFYGVVHAGSRRGPGPRGSARRGRRDSADESAAQTVQ
jgi:hypothetical protein